MSFNKDRLIVAQNSATVAANLISSLDEAHRGPGVDGLLDLFEQVRTAVFEASIALADGDIPGQTAGQASGGGGRKFRTKSAPKSDDNGAGVPLNFGKYSGKTIEEVYAADPSYIEWLSETSNNDFIRGKTTEFLASVG